MEQKNREKSQTRAGLKWAETTMQTAIPFLFMRGGTSRGPYFRRADLPSDESSLAEVLIAVVGSGHPLNIDGIGGGNPVTTKVAMLSQSDDEWADIDYLFAQVSVEEKRVDFRPTCGNILSGVGPAAIEMGLIAATDSVAEIRIRAVNTGARVLSRVETPGGLVQYAGDTRIDGVPGSGAPIELHFRQVAGSSTGAFLPTGALRNTIDGIEVTCMDVAMPMVIARAGDFGLSGTESPEVLNQDKAFFERMESVRLQAGRLMGMGDCSQSVTPKFGLLAPAKQGGSIGTRYFMPWSAHPSMAVTGSQCLSACALTPGTVADGLWRRPQSSPATVVLEHGSGTMEVIVNYAIDKGQFVHQSAGVIRTARKLAAGEVFIPHHVWS